MESVPAAGGILKHVVIDKCVASSEERSAHHKESLFGGVGAKVCFKD